MSGSDGAEAPSGVVVIDKPRGWSSHGVVARLRRTLGTRAVGHAGTLDPMATGALVVVSGEATKLAGWLTAEDKTYEATIALGVETDTLDADGRSVRAAPIGDGLRSALRAWRPEAALAPLLASAIGAERGRLEQIPPAYSAIQIDGRRAYVAARRGEAVALAARPVAVHRLAVLSCAEEPPSLRVVVEAAKGYYVRALARDLAAGLETFGHLTALRRTRSGGFGLDEALPPDAARDELLARMQPIAVAAARALPVARLSEAGAADARHGRAVRPGDIEVATRAPSAWLDPQGELVAVGTVDESGEGRVMRGFGGGR